MLLCEMVVLAAIRSIYGMAFRAELRADSHNLPLRGLDINQRVGCILAHFRFAWFSWAVTPGWHHLCICAGMCGGRVLDNTL